MIPYEELERALRRWNERRAGVREPVAEISESTAMGRTPGPVVVAVPPFHDGESSGELDMDEAVFDET